MSIKMRVLYHSNKGKMASFASAIAEKYNLTSNKVDVIPPAYSCDKERIVILGATLKDAVPDQLRLFSRELSKARAQNVALYIDGKESEALKLIETLKEAGTNVIDEVFYCNGGMPLKFLKKISDEEKESILAWTDRVLQKLV